MEDPATPTPNRRPTIRVAVVAPIPLHGIALAGCLERANGLCVVAVASEQGEARTLIRMLRPLVVLVDVSARDELATVLAITTEFPEVRVVALFVQECEDDVLACAANGAAGYVPSEGSLEDVTRVVECVARGEAVLSPRMAACLFKRVGETRAPASDAVATSALTHRESEVVALVAEGLSNKEIAARLSVAVPTIKNHVHSILRKLNVDRRAKIAAQSRPSPASWTPIRRAGPAADAESGRRRVRRFTTARAP